MNSRDLGRFVDHIESAMFIGVNILFISVKSHIGATLICDPICENPT